MIGHLVTEVYYNQVTKTTSCYSTHPTFLTVNTRTTPKSSRRKYTRGLALRSNIDRQTSVSPAQLVSNRSRLVPNMVLRISGTADMKAFCPPLPPLPSSSTRIIPIEWHRYLRYFVDRKKVLATPYLWNAYDLVRRKKKSERRTLRLRQNCDIRCYTQRIFRPTRQP